MAFAIEVQGEANPLSAQNVLNTLVQAASSSQQQVRSGTEQLQKWEKQGMYYSFLQGVFLDHTVPNEVRYLAIIQLKNGIDKYWRKTAAHAIKPEEKQHIKTKALEAGIIEPAPLLALHNSLMIAKIMRYEFPHDWPDAIPYIISSLRYSVQPDANPLQLSRTLLILLQIIKELSTARIQRTRHNLQSVSPEIFQLLANIYLEKFNEWGKILEEGGADAGQLLETVELSLVSLKVLRRLIIAGFEHPSRSREVQDFWVLTHLHFSKFHSLVDGPMNLPEAIHKGIEKHLLQLSKLHVEMAKVHPASFALLPESIALVQSYWSLVVALGDKYGSLGTGDGDEGKSLTEKTGLRALLLIRACTKMAFNPAQTFKYQTPEDKEERKQSVQLVKSQLFTEEFVVHAMELLVTKFFRFRKIDFQDWEEEPEDWEKREEENTEAWEFSIRSCSEKLFLDLVIHFKDLLIPRLLTVFYTFASTDNHDVLLKDSLYSAIGLAAASLEQHLDFNAFLEHTIVPEVQSQEHEYKLLRRRFALMLGQWVPVKGGELNMNAIYQIFQHLLGKNDPLNDMVVRITAGRQLRSVLDSYEFKPETFISFAPPILENLMSLVQEVESSETKMGLLETVRMVVVKMEDHVSTFIFLLASGVIDDKKITPFSDNIISLLPPLWESSGEEHLMKQAILTLLSSLIQSLRHESVRYHSLILPLIQSSVEPGSESIVYLLDEALDLWHAIIQATPSPASPDIISLLPSLFPILEAATDSTPQAIQILESYVFLAPQEVLGDRFRLQILVILESLLKSTTKQRLGVIPRLVDLMLRGAETVDGGSEATYRVISQSLLESSFLASLLEGLYSAHEASQTSGPHKKTSPVVGVVESDYYSVLARLAMASPTIFASSVAAATNSSEEQALTWILTEWFSHYDNIGSINQKKLHALALTQLLGLPGTPLDPSLPPSPPAYILAHLQSYLSMWTDLITELADGGTDPNADYLVCWNAPAESATAVPESTEVESPEVVRRRDWQSGDAIHRYTIRDFVRHRLQEVIVTCGGAQRFQDEWLVNVDTEVVSAFGALGLL
ncbi:Armadillo-like helical [Penicillium bovifimosum]|uniref:Armadillo-like helical n=1 Tax=Penicillium bovifimosum TaxID=126998 RepID=A0A9W9L1P4_9EURO|nr:Armadillo-like helical [Penicillium bovifimosum]KAJ5130955.1 Armadillo-like helical [Penicillium bovifimosum]